MENTSNDTNSSTTNSNKKPLYKKWWVWIIVVILLWLIFKGKDEGSSSSSTSHCQLDSTDAKTALMKYVANKGLKPIRVQLLSSTESKCRYVYRVYFEGSSTKKIQLDEKNGDWDIWFGDDY